MTPKFCLQWQEKWKNGNRARQRQTRRNGRRGGSVIVVTAVSFVVICGCAALAVDYGILVSDANRMQRACDAAVLAGVQELKKTGTGTDTVNAKNVAARVAVENGARNVTANDVEVTNNGTRISLAASVTRSFFFARVIGQTSKSVTRRAAAVVSTAAQAGSGSGAGAGRVSPIGITTETYNSYKDDFTKARSLQEPQYREITLVRQNKQVFNKDDFALFDLRDNNAKSPAQFLDQLTGQDNETTYLNDGATCAAEPLTCENTLNAAQPAASGKLLEGLGTLFDRATQAPWYDNTNDRDDDEILGTKAMTAQNGNMLDNPRVISLIVTNGTTMPNNGTWTTPVLGYAPVYIESIRKETQGGGKNQEDVFIMRVAFLGPIQAAEGTPRSENTDGNVSGLRVTSLVE